MFITLPCCHLLRFFKERIGDVHPFGIKMSYIFKSYQGQRQGKLLEGTKLSRGSRADAFLVLKL